MIRNVSGYQNFSTLGVVIILLVGSILVLVRFPRAYFNYPISFIHLVILQDLFNANYWIARSSY
jgi:hypothetical protein